MKAAVLISDNRMQVIARELEKCGVTVLMGSDETSLREIEEAAGTLDALLLPIRGVDGNGYFHIPGTDYPAEAMLQGLRPEAEVITGLRTEYLAGLKRPVINYYDDAKVRTANAGLTAEGVLYFFMDKTPKSMFEYRVDVIGYGYTGKAIAELFGKLGIPLRIVTDRPLDTCGFPVISYEEWKKGRPREVIINTAPVQVLTEEMAEQFPEDVLIIDIASNKVGAAPGLYERDGIRIEPAPALPGMVAEESAGLILAEYLKQRWKLA